MENKSPTGRVRGKYPTNEQLPPISLPPHSADLVHKVTEHPRDTPPDPVAEQKKKDEARRTDLVEQLSPIINNPDLAKQNEEHNIYNRLGVNESCSLDELQTAYDILSAALAFPEDVSILNTNGATEEQRILFNRLQKFKTRFQTAFTEIQKKIKERDAQRVEAIKTLKHFVDIRNTGKMFSDVLGISSTSDKVQIQGAYRRFILELDRAESFFTALITKRMSAMDKKNNVTLTDAELADLEINDDLKAQHIYFNQLFEMMTNMQNEFRFRDTKLSPGKARSHEAEQKSTPPKSEKDKLNQATSEFVDLMQEIIANPNGKTMNSIIIALRALVAIDATHFHLYADDLARVESIWKQIQYTPEKWSKEHIDTWLPKIKLQIIREAVGAIIYQTVEKSKTNEGEATENFSERFIAISRMGLDKILAFLDEHKDWKTPDALHTRKTIRAADTISRTLRSMLKEIDEVDFMLFHTKFNDANISEIFSNEFKVLSQDIGKVDQIRNICSEFVEKKASRTRPEKVKQFVLSHLHSGMPYDEIVASLKDQITKDEEIRAVWKRLETAKSVFATERTQASFREMSTSEIQSGKLAEYDDYTIHWDAIKNELLRQEAKKCFVAWAHTKQREWIGELETERTELAELIGRQVKNVIPLFIEATIIESNSIQTVFSAEDRTRLQTVIRGRLQSTLDNGLKFIDDSIRHLSPSAVNKSLTFVKAESRFNAVSAQTILQGKLKFEFAEDEQLGKKSIGKPDRGGKIAPLLHSALNRIGKSLYTELATIKKASMLAVDAHSRILQHPTIFVDSDYGAYSAGSGEKDDAFEARRKAALRDNMIALLLTRLVAKKDSPLKNHKVQSRVETITRLGLDQAMYFNVVSASKTVEFIEVRAEAEAYLIELGFTREELDAIDKNLMIPAEKQSLAKAVNKYLLDGGMPESREDIQEAKERKVELLDPDLVVQRQNLRDNLVLGSSFLRGRFSEYSVIKPILGDDREWLKPMRSTDVSLSGDVRMQRIQDFLKRGSIEYDLTGTIDYAKKIKSSLGKRVDKGSFYLEVPLDGALSSTDQMLIETLSKDTSYSQKDILREIQKRLEKSDKMRAFVKEFNAFIDAQVQEAVKDPDAFLTKIGLTPNTDAPLTPEGWLHIFYSIGVGRFGALSEVSRSPNRPMLYGLGLSGRTLL